MEELTWSENPLMYRQLGILPNPPIKSLPDLELNLELDLATPLSTPETSTISSVINKSAAAQVDDSLNNGNFTLQSLNLSPDALVYGLTDTPLGAQQYVKWLQEMKEASTDLRFENQPYRAVVAQGDWTATAAFLSRTHTGDLVLPAYMSDKPVAATGKSFDQLHYTIA